jgi:hypothetical protein
MWNLTLKIKAAHLEKGAPLHFTGLRIQFIWVALFAAKARKGSRPAVASNCRIPALRPTRFLVYCQEPVLRKDIKQ